jgi:hypothetical protein
MYTAVIIFNLIASGAAELASTPTQVASTSMPEDKCQEVLVEQMNRLRTGLEHKYGKGALLITGACFSGVLRGPDGHLFFPQVKPEAAPEQSAPEQKDFR